MASVPRSDDFISGGSRGGGTAVDGVAPGPVRTTVFICYSHRDRVWLDRLSAHLSPIQGSVDLWDDRRIRPGDRWMNHIETALSMAKAAVLLVTADFIASDFIRNVELPRLLGAADEGGCRVIPVIVRRSMFEHLPELSCFQPINPPDHPLNALSEHEQDEIFVELTLTLLRVLQRPPSCSPLSRPAALRSTLR